MKDQLMNLQLLVKFLDPELCNYLGNFLFSFGFTLAIPNESKTVFETKLIYLCNGSYQNRACYYRQYGGIFLFFLAFQRVTSRAICISVFDGCLLCSRGSSASQT